MSHSSVIGWLVKIFSVGTHAILGKHVAPSLSLRWMDRDLHPMCNKANRVTGGHCGGDTNNASDRKANKGHRWLDSQELFWLHPWHLLPLNQNLSFFCLSALFSPKVFSPISWDDEVLRWIVVPLWRDSQHTVYIVNAFQNEMRVRQNPSVNPSLC